MNTAAVKNDEKSRDKVWDMIKDIRVCLMVTQDGMGKFHARPMVAQQEEFDGKLWFYTSIRSPKIPEIEQNYHVLLSYSEPDDQNYVSINGTARIVQDRDKIRDYWSEYLRTWFPEGKDDPDIALICVDVEDAEYWDSPSSSFVYLYGYAKAVLTGERPQGGENEKVRF